MILSTIFLKKHRCTKKICQMRNKIKNPNVMDYMAVASMTDGMVGAELANIIEVAAINMMRDSRTEVIAYTILPDSYCSGISL
ncbi:hypothetical protein JHK86_050410 [Glycine max]|nr:hypothetical protein JHK86_050410 [Glycine max]